VTDADANETAIRTVSITIISLNDAPIANAGSLTTAVNTPFDRILTGSDVDGDSLTCSVVTSPAHGTLLPSPDGTFTYAPNPGYSGPDFFTFKANDGQADSNVATFNITVTDVDTALTLTLPSNAATVGKDSTKVQIDPAASVSDTDTVVNYGNARAKVTILNGNTASDSSRSRVTLSVINQGTGAGRVKLKGSKIFFDGGKTSIAKITGGSGGKPLIVPFTSAATEQAVNAVLNQMSIKASKKATTGIRTIGIEVTAGGQTAQSTQMANIA